MSRRRTAWLAGHVAFLAAGLALVTCGMAASAASDQTPWTGQVTWVSDGDTLWLRPRSGGEAVKVRILGIDAPEGCQAGGAAATAALLALVRRQPLVVFPTGHDDYGRLLARLERDHLDIGRQLVLTGQAWSYHFRGDPGPYAAEEAQARAARRGVFEDAQALPPREFRRQHGPCRRP